MNLAVYLTFVGTSLLLALAPGPDNLFVLAQSATCGAKSGLAVVAGLITGLVCQTLAAAMGIAAVVAATPWLFWAVRLVGAAYLLYLAVGAWRSGVSEAHAGTVAGNAPSMASLWRRGVIMNVTNPKVQIFFLAFFPQFVTPGADGLQTVTEMVILGVTFMAATAVVFGSIALFAGSIADRLRTPKVQMLLNRASAVLFVLLAAGTVAGI